MEDADFTGGLIASMMVRYASGDGAQHRRFSIVSRVVVIALETGFFTVVSTSTGARLEANKNGSLNVAIVVDFFGETVDQR